MNAMLTAAILLAQAAVEGNPRAALRIVIYEDLQCADCAALRMMLDDYLLPRYGSKVAFEHRDFPLPKHHWARRAAIAARYFEAQRPEAGTAFRRYIFAILKKTNEAVFDERVRDFARQEGFDAADAVRSLGSEALEAAVEKDYQEGIARGISKTPTVAVDGQLFVEKFSRDALASAIEKALNK
jgi:protein-disulfide isomerase